MDKSVDPSLCNVTREQHIVLGRRLGENEATSRNEIEPYRTERIARAMTYAAWEWDGKPASSEGQRKEFGVHAELTPSLERALAPVRKRDE